MKSTLLYKLGLVSIFSAFILIGYFFYILLVPANLVYIKKVTTVPQTIKRGQVLEKTIEICKKVETPITITYELENGDIVPLATKFDYSGKGCKNYIIAQTVPSQVSTGYHHLLVVVSYKNHFKDEYVKLVGDNIFIK